jgi:hypothetical protein
MFGAKIENIKVNGNITKCMGKVKFNGPMEENMKVNIKMIKNMDSVLFIGRMEEAI